MQRKWDSSLSLGAPIEPDFSGCFNSCLYLWLGPALDGICFVNKHGRKLQARAAAERPLVERLVIWGQWKGDESYLICSGGTLGMCEGERPEWDWIGSFVCASLPWGL